MASHSSFPTEDKPLVLPTTLHDANKEDIYVRFQIPRLGQNPEDARVTQEIWNTNPGAVADAFRNFHNINGNNVMLWMRYDMWALQYAGIYSHSSVRGITPQRGLDQDNVVVTYIMPSGVKKLEQVKVTPGSDWSANDREVAGAVFGIRSIGGRGLSDADYSYNKVSDIKGSLRRFRDKEIRSFNIPTWDKRFQHLHEVKLSIPG
ncbi:hypothetical protein BDV24DRAFT_158634 [Aspergillus arachidicola]|uniref:Uncharacterized protein n=1 Tax=Aspergillus arachidicola TaxID=656916 RepID=A0A2G7FHB8_9EURO|nr:hypothetical protein BDV24DRAFT_158634 [Aspergillus arachidicola]PIG79889.1 hypothetical protein AARAC_010463 [Aspergillus arachidicola]